MSRCKYLIQSNTVFDLVIGVKGHMRCCPVHAISSVYSFEISYVLLILTLPRTTVLKKMRFQENTLFDLGRTKCCTAAKVEVATANGSGGDAFTQNTF